MNYPPCNSLAEVKARYPNPGPSDTCVLRNTTGPERTFIAIVIDGKWVEEDFTAESVPETLVDWKENYPHTTRSGL